MRRLILGLAADPIADPDLKGTDAVGIDAETQRYLDGAEITHGHAATSLETETEHVEFGSDWVETERRPTTERVATEFFADLHADPAFVAVDSGDGEFLFEYVGVRHGTIVGRATFDVDRFRRDLQAAEKARCWHACTDDDGAVSMDYHDAAEFDAPGEAAQIGFAYMWDGRPMRGVVAASGYAALFHDEPAPTVGRWIRDELLPYASVGDEQAELDGGASE